jgi:hypothetical protein
VRIANNLLIPYERAHVQTTLKLEEIRERISASIDRGLPWWLAYLTFDRNGKYFGRETSEGFWVVRALPWANSYRPYLWIGLHPRISGTLVSLVFFGYGVIALPVVLTTVLLVLGFGFGQWRMTAFFFIVGFCLHILGWFACGMEKKHLQSWLDAILKG